MPVGKFQQPCIIYINGKNLKIIISPKIVFFRHNSLIDADGDDGIGEGLAGEDDEAVDPYEEVSKARLEMMPVVKEVKIDPKNILPPSPSS